MVQIGFSLQPQYDLPMEQIIVLLKQAGFTAVSPTWSESLSSVVAIARQAGLTVQSIHGPCKNICNLWQPGHPEAEAIKARVLKSIDDCARLEIPTVVLHGWNGFFYDFEESSLYFDLFDEIVSHGQACGVSIAFENLEGVEFLLSLLSRYEKFPHVGYCWDSGHAHCYPHEADLIQKFADRLIMTHLHDNYGLRDPGGQPAGTDDLHFLPYDGTIPWEHAIGKLKNAKRQDILNFEIKMRSHSNAPEDLIYANLSPEQFITEAANRARRIASLYDALLSQ